MLIKTICNQCKVVLEYDDKSVCEGNRDFEDVNCPKCGNKVATVFTDLIPTVRIVNDNENMK